jgi:hypothetical protein
LATNTPGSNVIRHWLHSLAIAALVLAIVSTLAIAVDVIRHSQKMWIMNVVWPVSGLYAGPLALAFYARYGRPQSGKASFPVMAAKGTLHCGAGCTLGDVIAEGIAVAVPGVAFAFGWQSVFAEKIFAIWVLDFVLAS